MLRAEACTVFMYEQHYNTHHMFHCCSANVHSCLLSQANHCLDHRFCKLINRKLKKGFNSSYPMGCEVFSPAVKCTMYIYQALTVDSNKPTTAKLFSFTDDVTLTSHRHNTRHEKNGEDDIYQQLVTIELTKSNDDRALDLSNNCILCPALLYFINHVLSTLQYEETLLCMYHSEAKIAIPSRDTIPFRHLGKINCKIVPFWRCAFCSLIFNNVLPVTLHYCRSNRELTINLEF